MLCAFFFCSIDFATTDFAGALCDQANADVLNGGSDVDLLFRSVGVDFLPGDNGNGLLSGGADGDSIESSQGHDRIFGGTGSDVICCGAGSDRGVAGQGDDTARGGGEGEDVYATTVPRCRICSPNGGPCERCG